MGVFMELSSSHDASGGSREEAASLTSATPLQPAVGAAGALGRGWATEVAEDETECEARGF